VQNLKTCWKPTPACNWADRANVRSSDCPPAFVYFEFWTLTIMEPRADIAVIGLAVMGQNLILNMNDHGFTVAAFNRTVAKVDEFLNNEAKGTKVVGAHSLEEMVGLLKRPRRVMLMVKAGKPVDEFIEP